MNRSDRVFVAVMSLWVAVSAGCAVVDPQADFDQVGRHVQAATAHGRIYRPGDEDEIARRVDVLLEEGLTVDAAIEICLLNNPTFQAACMDVGLARADVVQSGLLSNPMLGVSVRFPSGGGLANLDAGIAQNIADLWQLPARKLVAGHALDRAVLDLARRAAELAAEVKVVYFKVVATERVLEVARRNLATTQELLESSLARQQAGAGNQLAPNLSRSLVHDAEAEVQAARLATADARRSLARLLGVTTPPDQLALLDSLPEISVQALDAEQLIRTAREKRLDIQVAARAVSAAQADVQLQLRRVFPTVNAGLAVERGERGKSAGGRDLLADTARASIAHGALTAPEIQPRSQGRRHTEAIVGPRLDMELPLFDRNQARIAKAQFALGQAIKTHEALQRAVVHDVGGALDRATTAWKLVALGRDQSIPLAQSNLELSREAYQAGQTSFLGVLEAQRFFLQAQRRHLEAWQVAAVTIPELERTIGIPLSQLNAIAEPQGQEPQVETQGEQE